MSETTKQEIFIKQVQAGDQSSVVEQGLAILGQPPESLGWFTSEDAQPKFVVEEHKLEDGTTVGSGMWMLPIWTRRLDSKDKTDKADKADAALRIQQLEDAVRALCYAIEKFRKDTRAEAALHGAELVGWATLNAPITEALHAQVFKGQK